MSSFGQGHIDYSKEIILPELKEEMDKKEYSYQIKRPNGNTFELTIKKGSKHIVNTLFNLTCLDGCCKYAIMYGTGILRENDSDDWIKYSVLFAEALSRAEGYTVMLYSVADYQEELSSFLEKNGWTKIEEGKNKRSGNWVSLYKKEI